MEGKWIDRGLQWKDRARALRLRIRDRVRVAVDRRRHRLGLAPEASHHHHYYPPALQRWAHRLRSFLALHPSQQRKPSPSPSRFYLKRVGKDVEALDDSVIVRMLQAVAVPVLGNACHIFMHGLNRIQIYGAEKLHEALLKRPEGKPLITVSNHVAAVDDPFVIASLLPPNVMLDARNIRWTLCATDRCFSNPVLSAFFRCVKVLPVSRGDGIYQKGMDMALSKLNNGGWVHIFPEGSRSRDGGRTIGAAKRGVGRLVMDADKLPLVVPFVHSGMQDIMPVGTHLPKTGKGVTVVVGDPIHFKDLLPANDAADFTNVSRGLLYDAVSARITLRLQELKVQVDRLVLEQSLEVEYTYASNSERASGIWQQVDWEAFGLDGIAPSSDTPQTSIKPRLSLEANPKPDQHQVNASTHRSFKMGFSYESGIMSRIRGYVNPSEFMGFAARGLFADVEYPEESSLEDWELWPLRVWKSFLEANLLQKLNAF